MVSRAWAARLKLNKNFVIDPLVVHISDDYFCPAHFRPPLNLTLQCGPSLSASSQICGRHMPILIECALVQLELLRPVLAITRRVMA